MKLAQYNGYSISTVDTDDLVLQHQGISSYSAQYAVMRFKVDTTFSNFYLFWADSVPGPGGQICIPLLTHWP